MGKSAREVYDRLALSTDRREVCKQVPSMVWLMIDELILDLY